MRADDIAVAHTPPGGYGEQMPPPGIEVTRRLDGDQLVWDYGPMFTARLERTGGHA
jgi:hypothetical protein